MKKIAVIIVLLLILVPIAAYIFYLNEINKPGNKADAVQEFEIKPGEGVKAIGANLEDGKFIDSAYFFEVYIWLKKNETKLQAGSYEIKPGMSIIDIVDKFTGGDVAIKEKNVKILEGWKIDDMEKYLKEEGWGFSGEFAQLAKTPVSSWPFTFDKSNFFEADSAVNLEGYLFPDTYRIFEDSKAEDLIAKMLRNFDKKLTPEFREEITKQGKSIHDIVTMASIIEKEVNTEKDAAIVSGILYKRLNLGMRLEVDSTVNYLSGKNDPSATLEDLQIDSPYNTYKYGGLPPGPICNPGLWAIKAAIYPEESPYLFYLNRQDTGETIFSKNFEEHVRNKNKYLK